MALRTERQVDLQVDVRCGAVCVPRSGKGEVCITRRGLGCRAAGPLRGQMGPPPSSSATSTPERTEKCGHEQGPGSFQTQPASSVTAYIYIHIHTYILYILYIHTVHTHHTKPILITKYIRCDILWLCHVNRHFNVYQSGHASNAHGL